MKAAAVLLSMFVIVPVAVIMSGNVSGAEFPGAGELFDPDNLNFPDFSVGDLFGMARELVDPDTFSSIASLSGFFGFLGNTFADLFTDSGGKGIGGIVMLLCIVVILLCVLSALVGTLKGRKFIRERNDE